MVAPSRHGAQVLAGLMEVARFMVCLVWLGSNPRSRAVAVAAPMVPQVPWECTSRRPLVAPPMRELTS